MLSHCTRLAAPMEAQQPGHHAYKSFAINVRHSTCRLHSPSLQTWPVSLLDRRLGVGRVNYRGGFSKLFGDPNISSHPPVNKARKRFRWPDSSSRVVHTCPRHESLAKPCWAPVRRWEGLSCTKSLTCPWRIARAQSLARLRHYRSKAKVVAVARKGG